MRVIIVGPTQSGKTTLLHKIIRMNPTLTFQILLDGFEALAQAGNDILANLPPNASFIISALTIEALPVHVRNGAIVLNAQTIRAL